MTTFARPAAAPPRAVPAAAFALGCVALAVREWSVLSIVPILMVGAVGFAMPASRAARGSVRRWALVTLCGVLAFGAVRFMSPAFPITAWTLAGLGRNVIAAFAEEAFFRRFAYGWLERWGAPLAIGVTSLAFALVHVPVYGPRVFLLDLGAGIVLGWQRWASGGWTAPAATHAIANVLMMR